MRLSTGIALTALSGALYGLAFPPLRWWPLAWIALVPFLLAVRDGSARRAIGLGALFGVVASYAVGTWMPLAVVQYYEQSVVVGAVVFFACAVLQASWQFAGFAWLYRRAARRGGAAAPLLAAAIWTTAELARAKPTIGNPWALLGYSQASLPILVQTADVAGIFGVGFLIAAVNAGLAGVWVARQRPADRPAAWRGMAAAAVVVASAVGYGAVAMGRFPPGGTTEAIPVAVAQGNLDLGVQWKPEFYGANLETYARLTLAAVAPRPPRLVVWPESALTFFLEAEPIYRAYLGDLLGRSGTQLLTGGPRSARPPDGGALEYRNAAFVVSPAGTIDATYEKGVLVPFAEYFPLPALDFLRRQFGHVREFTPGNLQRPLPTVAGPAGVTICNESMLAEHTIARVHDGAEWLVTLANDSWVGQRQYADIAFEMGRVRAVEVRRWLVRSSTSGPSGVIDPAGRVVDRLAFDTRGVAHGEIVPRQGLTVYARVGDAFAWACVLVAVAVALLP